MSKTAKKSSESFKRQVWRRYRRSKAGLLGLAITATILILGILAPALANDKPLVCKYDGKLYAPAMKELLQRNLPYGKQLFPHSNPFDQVTFDWEFRHDPERGDWKWSTPIPFGPFQTDSRNKLQKPSGSHWLGTDEVGRDMTARMIHGARVSMMVGFVSVSISTFIGLVLGALAGYFGGWVDAVISRLIEIMMCFPVFFLILTILALVAKPSIWLVMLVSTLR